MFTRSGRSYGTDHPQAPPQNDRIQELIQQMTAMNRRIDFLYSRSVEGPDGSSSHNKEGETEGNLQRDNVEGEEPPPVGGERGPPPPFPTRGVHQPPPMRCGENAGYQFYEAPPPPRGGFHQPPL
jgi:hypothetical protein